MCIFSTAKRASGYMLQQVVDMLQRYKNRDNSNEGLEMSTGTFKKNNAETVWLEGVGGDDTRKISSLPGKAKT